MQKNPKMKTLFCVALGILACSISRSPAQERIVLRFNNSASANNWVKWWGSAPTTLSFDNTLDAAYNLSSGSLKAVVQFDYAAYGGDNQFALRGALSGDGNLNGKVVDASKYDRLEFDLYWDPASPQRPSGDLGGLDVGLVPTDYSQVWLTNMPVQAVGGWQHISIAITNAGQADLSAIGGVVFKMWSGDANSAQTGTATFWLDNVKLMPKGFVSDFDTGSFVDNGAFWNWWGGATRSVFWDYMTDAANDTNSGSIKFSVDFPGSGDNQYAEGMSLSGHGTYNGGMVIPTANYSALEFDLKMDSASSTMLADMVNTNGDPLGLGVGLGSTSWGQTWIPNASQARLVPDGAWHHVSMPLDPTWPDTAGLVFKKWFSASAQFTGNVSFWIDNIAFIPSSAPPPPPTMSLRPAKNGLNLLLSQPGQQYQRESIRSIPADAVQWYGNAEPVTYSLTIADFPNGATYPGVQCHIFLVPDTAGGNAPDYADANAIMLDIREAANGAATATFHYKTNQPNANSQMYSTSQGQLGTLNAPTVIGTWSLRFDNNTNITITGPGNSSLSLVMPQESAALFHASTAMGTYFGIQPNNPANIGQGVAISEIKITSGSTVVVDDTFSTIDPTQQVDPALWTLRLDSPVAISVITQQPSYWLGWSLPDAGFTLLSRTNLTTAPAVDPGLTPFQNGGSKTVLLTPSLLPDPKQTFFFLQK